MRKTKVDLQKSKMFEKASKDGDGCSVVAHNCIICPFSNALDAASPDQFHCIFTREYVKYEENIEKNIKLIESL